MDIAQKRVAVWVERGDANAPLNLSRLRLDVLPDMPAEIQKLDVSHNDLVALGALPRDLRILDVSHNPIRNLDGLPPGIQYLVYSAGQLGRETLPAGIRSVEIV
jgi:hypothetical protein